MAKKHLDAQYKENFRPDDAALDQQVDAALADVSMDALYGFDKPQVSPANTTGLRKGRVVSISKDDVFVDFGGKQRSVKEFRGKYLLIEWWGVWCIDCVRDTPYTVQAYERFRSRGFEVLGLNWDDKVEDAATFLEKSKAPWPQARKDSIKTVTEVTYRIQEFPSSILLDPDGKVVSLNQKSLQGPRLVETLERIMPK